MADSTGKQDPLAVLENILNEAKQKTPNGTTKSGKGKVSTSPTQASGQPIAKPPSPEEVAELEVEEKRQEDEEKQRQVQLEAERLRLIEEQKQKLENELKQTPQYQARVQQETEEKEEQSQHQAAGEGFEIRQLGHTKI